MKTQDYTSSFEVGQTPEQVFEAICDVRGWWGSGVEGNSRAVGDEFVYRHGDVHYSRHRLTEVVPGKKIVWLTADSRVNFVANPDEWAGTVISFDIVAAGSGDGSGSSAGSGSGDWPAGSGPGTGRAGNGQGKTTVRFTHTGLTPLLECYGGCSGAWEFYIGESLRKLIETGKGEPDPK